MGAGLPAHVEEADLISYGLLGLIGAIERFDLDARDQVRDLRDHPHQGRDHRRAALARLGAALGARAAREIEKASAQLENKPHRAPTDEEMADELGVSVDEFQDDAARRSPTPRSLALDELWTVSDSDGDQVSLLDTIDDPNAHDPEEAFDTVELKDRLAEAIDVACPSARSSSSRSTTTRT